MSALGTMPHSLSFPGPGPYPRAAPTAVPQQQCTGGHGEISAGGWVVLILLGWPWSPELLGSGTSGTELRA